MTTSEDQDPRPGDVVVPRPKSHGLRDILIATDFSPGAKRSVERAAWLPLAGGARVHLIHVRQAAGGAEGDAEEASAREALRVEADRLAEVARGAGNGGLELHTHVLVGSPRREIVQLAGQLNVDLVVLGRHGVRPIGDLFLGSTANAVIRQARASVLVVNRAATQGYRTPLVALELAEGDATERVAEFALAIVDPCAERVVAVHAYAVPFESRMALDLQSHQFAAYQGTYAEGASAGLKRRLSSIVAPGAGWSLSVRSGAAADVIIKEASGVGADLVVTGTHGRSGVWRALLGSVAEAVVGGVECDVLVVWPDGSRGEPA